MGTYSHSKDDKDYHDEQVKSLLTFLTVHMMSVSALDLRRVSF